LFLARSVAASLATHGREVIAENEQMFSIATLVANFNLAG
jgi:hypothetical protein